MFTNQIHSMLNFSISFTDVHHLYAFRLFDDNLLAVDQGVERITKLFNDLFQDDRTAFIFTADHGMTDRGCTMYWM